VLRLLLHGLLLGQGERGLFQWADEPLAWLLLNEAAVFSNSVSVKSEWAARDRDDLLLNGNDLTDVF
jgi:hypothetical protein